MNKEQGGFRKSRECVDQITPDHVDMALEGSVGIGKIRLFCHGHPEGKFPEIVQHQSYR